MNAAASLPSSGQLPASYDEAVNQHLKFYSRVTCVVAMVLVALGVGLDLAFYPEHARPFAVARFLVVALIGLTLWSYSTPVGARHIRQLTYFWIALPQLMIAWMVFYSDGEASIYFVGLTFAISGIGVFLPLSVREAVAFSGLTLVVYVMACLLRPGGVQQWPVFAGQLIFIAFYGAIAITISIYSARWRSQAFTLQAEVQRQRNELLDINQALTEVKGQLIQREKMAAIGTLSAGLLHELNNPVNYSLMAINMGLTLPSAKSRRDAQGESGRCQGGHGAHPEHRLRSQDLRLPEAGSGQHAAVSAGARLALGPAAGGA